MEAAKIKKWLEIIAFPEYYDNFINNGYGTLAAISKINGDKLSDIGVKRGHKKVIMEAIAEISVEASPPPPTMTTTAPATRMSTPPLVEKNSFRYKNGDIIHEGYLQKKGRGFTHAWKQRYFDIIMTPLGIILRWFPDNNRKETLGQIDVEGAIIEDLEAKMLEEKKRGTTVFRFSVDKHGTLIMYAESKAEKDMWYKTLSELSLINVKNNASFSEEGVVGASHRKSIFEDNDDKEDRVPSGRSSPIAPPPPPVNNISTATPQTNNSNSNLLPKEEKIEIVPITASNLTSALPAPVKPKLPPGAVPMGGMLPVTGPVLTKMKEEEVIDGEAVKPVRQGFGAGVNNEMANALANRKLKSVNDPPAGDSSSAVNALPLMNKPEPAWKTKALKKANPTVGIDDETIAPAPTTTETKEEIPAWKKNLINKKETGNKPEILLSPSKGSIANDSSFSAPKESEPTLISPSSSLEMDASKMTKLEAMKIAKAKALAEEQARKEEAKLKTQAALEKNREKYGSPRRETGMTEDDFSFPVSNELKKEVVEEIVKPIDLTPLQSKTSEPLLPKYESERDMASRISDAPPPPRYVSISESLPPPPSVISFSPPPPNSTPPISPNTEGLPTFPLTPPPPPLSSPKFDESKPVVPSRRPPTVSQEAINIEKPEIEKSKEVIISPSIVIVPSVDDDDDMPPPPPPPKSNSSIAVNDESARLEKERIEKEKLEAHEELNRKIEQEKIDAAKKEAARKQEIIDKQIADAKAERMRLAAEEDAKLDLQRKEKDKQEKERIKKEADRLLSIQKELDNEQQRLIREKALLEDSLLEKKRQEEEINNLKLKLEDERVKLEAFRLEEEKAAEARALKYAEDTEARREALKEIDAALFKVKELHEKSVEASRQAIEAAENAKKADASVIEAVAELNRLKTKHFGDDEPSRNTSRSVMSPPLSSIAKKMLNPQSSFNGLSVNPTLERKDSSSSFSEGITPLPLPPNFTDGIVPLPAPPKSVTRAKQEGNGTPTQSRSSIDQRGGKSESPRVPGPPPAPPLPPPPTT